MMRSVIFGWWCAVAALGGCASTRSPMPAGFGIETPPAIPILPPAAEAATPPAPPRDTAPRADAATTPLTLDEVLATLERNFPLITAAEQERAIATGLRLSAEGSFDTSVRLRGANREGTFGNSTLDVGFEQPAAFHGINVFGGYRFGLGDFPVYQGGLKTAQGGEFRTGFLLPLLRDGPIDRRRALLRQTQLGELLADPAVRRVRIDAYRATRRAYYNWLAAAEFYQVADSFVRITREREAIMRERLRLGAVTELDAAQAQQALAEREGRLASADQRFKQASIDLSLFYRDGAGQALMPSAARIPRPITALQPPDISTESVATAAATAIAQRPELQRFQLQKERIGIDIRLAQNQMQPGLNLGVAAAQDVGPTKKSFPSDGIFALDRTFAETFLTFDLPVQRRDARGRLMTATAQMNQLIAQEQYARDQITQEVQTALTVLERDLQRLEKARTEFAAADKVARIARDQFDRGAIRLFELNALELNALDAQAKIIDLLADSYRALADYRGTLGFDRLNSSEP